MFQSLKIKIEKLSQMKSILKILPKLKGMAIDESSNY